MAILIFVLCALALFFLSVIVADNRRFVVRRYEVRSPKIKEDVSLVFISDLHDHVYGQDNDRLTEAVADARPDVILVGGDQIISGRARHLGMEDVSWMDVSLSLLEKLTRIAPVFLADGNHENNLLCEEEFRPLYDAYMERVSALGVTHLFNERTDPVPERKTNVELMAFSLTKPMYRKLFRYRLEAEEIRGILPKPDPDAFTLLLAHHPGFFPAYASFGADLTLSGHFHGGLMRLGRQGVIGADLHLFPRYSGGLYHMGTRAMIASCGLGAHTLPIRIFNPGELSVIRLGPENG